MAKKSAVSHTFAAFLSMVAGKLCLGYYSRFFPDMFGKMESFVARGCLKIQELLNISFDPALVIPLAIGLSLSFLWGYFYHLIRHD